MSETGENLAGGNEPEKRSGDQRREGDEIKPDPAPDKQRENNSEKRKQSDLVKSHERSPRRNDSDNGQS